MAYHCGMCVRIWALKWPLFVSPALKVGKAMAFFFLFLVWPLFFFVFKDKSLAFDSISSFGGGKIGFSHATKEQKKGSFLSKIQEFYPISTRLSLST